MEWELRDIGPDFFENAPYRCVSTATLQAPPAAIFSALTDDPSTWGDWNPGFSRKGRYTTSPPYGPGSVREVTMAGIRYTDTILEWEEPGHWSFRVSRAGAPFAGALAEDYRIGPAVGGSTIQWTIAMEPRAALGAARPLMDLFLPRYFKKAMANLDRRLTSA